MKYRVKDRKDFVLNDEVLSAYKLNSLLVYRREYVEPLVKGMVVPGEEKLYRVKGIIWEPKIYEAEKLYRL